MVEGLAVGTGMGVGCGAGVAVSTSSCFGSFTRSIAAGGAVVGGAGLNLDVGGEVGERVGAVGLAGARDTVGSVGVQSC